jgi:hypothetical protein
MTATSLQKGQHSHMDIQTERDARARAVTSRHEPAEDSSTLLERPLAPASSVDGFRRSLLLEQQALCETLTIARPCIREKLQSLIENLYAMLRTPIFPKGTYRALGESLVRAIDNRDTTIHLRGVLASPTAAVEVESFLRCAAIFAQHGFMPDLTLLLVRWDNLVDLQRQSSRALTHAFQEQVHAITAQTRRAGFMDAVIPVNVDIDAHTTDVRYPLDVRDWSHRIARAARALRTTDTALTRDVAWTRGFYARQASLNHLGEGQALVDLALRRAIGQRISQDYLSRPRVEDEVFLLVTSELHKRFLPCYDAAAPILNIETRTPSDASADSVAAHVAVA